MLAPGRLGVRYRAVLTDFGVSHGQVKTVFIEFSTFMQTNAPYLAPELFPRRYMAKEKRVTLAGDIYAFGCVFLQVCFYPD